MTLALPKVAEAARLTRQAWILLGSMVDHLMEATGSFANPLTYARRSNLEPWSQGVRDDEAS